MPLTYFTAHSDMPPHIRAGDLVSLNDENPNEPVMVHRPAVGVGVSDVAAWVGAGALAPVIPSGGAVVVPLSPGARPRLRLLPRDDQQTA